MTMHIDVFQTLADPTRRHIVEVLQSGEHAVNDIVGAVGIDQSGVSRHLGILHKAGFVQVRRMGPSVSIRFGQSPSASSINGRPPIEASGRRASTSSPRRSTASKRRAQQKARGGPAT